MTRLCFAASLLLAACRVEQGACPSPSDCACPCSDESAPTCADTGRVYQNACMLECDGAVEAACLGGSAECASECADAGGDPQCGSTTDADGNDTFTMYPTSCHRACAGAKKEGDNRC